MNPDAPLFVPAAFQQVEDFSPQWWDLVKSTAWFRDHWYHEHQQLDDMLRAFEAEDNLAGLVPDAIDEDLFYDHSASTVHPPVALKTDAVLKALVSPKGGDARKGFPEKPRYAEKATKQQPQKRRCSALHPPASLGSDDQIQGSSCAFCAPGCCRRVSAITSSGVPL